MFLVRQCHLVAKLGIYLHSLLNTKRQQTKNIQKAKTFRVEKYPFLGELSRDSRNRCDGEVECTTVK